MPPLTELPYLRQLAAESVYISREAAADFRKPVNSPRRAVETMRAFPLSNWTEIDHDPASSFGHMKQDGYF